MLQKICREYKNAFQLSNFKTLGKNNTWWFYVYMLTLFPCICHMFDTLKEAVCYYSLAIPLLFVRLSADLYPLTLPKMMFLCPMDARERICYLKLCYRLKVGLTTAFAALCLLLLSLFGIFSPACSLYLLFHFFCTSLGCNLQPASLSMQYKQDKKHPVFFSGFSVWNIFHFTVGIIILFSVFLFSEEDLSSPVMTVLALVGLFLQVLLTVRVLKFYRPILAAATDYETAIGLKERMANSI